MRQFIGLYDDEGRIIWCSDYYPGVTAEEVLGSRMWEFATTPEDRATIESAAGRCLIGSESPQYFDACSTVGEEPVIWRSRIEKIPKGCAIVSIARPIDPRVGLLSKREQDALCLSAVMSAKEAGARMGISHRTVSAHRRRAGEKLGLTGPRLTIWTIRELGHLITDDMIEGK